MMLWRCPRDGCILQEVKTRNMFTKHAGCKRCGVLYVLWGETITRCTTPRYCGGEVWSYVQVKPEPEKPPQSGPEGTRKI